MQARIASNDTPDPQDDTLQPACTSEGALAYPARRISQLAREFGEDGIVQSICQPDFGDAVGFLLERVTARMRDPG